MPPASTWGLTLAESKAETFHPVAFFGYLVDEHNQTVPCQCWVDSWGNMQWRPMQIMEMKSERPQAIAGYLEEDDE